MNANVAVADEIDDERPDDLLSAGSPFGGFMSNLPKFEMPNFAGVWDQLGKTVKIALAVIAVVAVIAIGGFLVVSNHVEIQVPYSTSVVAKVTVPGLNVRIAPSEKTQVLGSFGQNGPVTALYRDWSSQWVYAKSSNGEGWVSATYLQPQGGASFASLPLHRSQRILEFYLPLALLIAVVAFVDRMRDAFDLVWMGLAFVLLFWVQPNPAHIASAHILIAIAIFLIGYACIAGMFDFKPASGKINVKIVPGKFDLTPAYMFCSVVAAFISILNMNGVFAYTNPAGSASVFAVFGVVIGIIEISRQSCRISNLVQAAITCLIVVLCSFTGANPVLLILVIVALSVVMASAAGSIQLRSGKTNLVCTDWPNREVTINGNKKVLYFPADLCGLALAVMILCSL